MRCLGVAQVVEQLSIKNEFCLLILKILTAKLTYGGKKAGWIPALRLGSGRLNA